MNFSQSYSPDFPAALRNPIDFRNLHQKYMRPGIDNTSRLYYPVVERPVWTYMRYNPLILLFVFFRSIQRYRKGIRVLRRSRYYLHMYGRKRRGTPNVDYRVRFNKRRIPVRIRKNLLAKILLRYTELAMILAFIIPWQWALSATVFYSFFGRSGRIQRERRIKQRLQFAPAAATTIEQFNPFNMLRVWRLPRTFYRKVYWNHRFKPYLALLKRWWYFFVFGWIALYALRKSTQPRSATGDVPTNRRGVPGNVKRFLRDYTHPFQIQDWHKPHAWLMLNGDVWQQYNARRMRYGQAPATTMTQWKGHNVDGELNLASGTRL